MPGSIIEGYPTPALESSLSFLRFSSIALSCLNTLIQFFPASIEFRQSSFLWANDLSSYDVFAKLPWNLPFYGSHVSLFSLIWVISTLVFTYYSTKDQDFSMNPAMKYMQYFMPIMMFFFFNKFASGLSAYLSFSNLLNIGQTIVTKNFLIDHDKIKRDLDATKAKPKVVTGFRAKLQNAMAEQQKVQEAAKSGAALGPL